MLNRSRAWRNAVLGSAFVAAAGLTGVALHSAFRNGNEPEARTVDQSKSSAGGCAAKPSNLEERVDELPTDETPADHVDSGVRIRTIHSELKLDRLKHSFKAPMDNQAVKTFDTNVNRAGNLQIETSQWPFEDQTTIFKKKDLEEMANTMKEDEWFSNTVVDALAIVASHSADANCTVLSCSLALVHSQAPALSTCAVEWREKPIHRIVFPFCHKHGGHFWTIELVIGTDTNAKINIYDSNINSNPTKQQPDVVTSYYLDPMSQLLRAVLGPDHEWDVYLKDCIQQKDATSCGPIACTHVQMLASGQVQPDYNGNCRIEAFERLVDNRFCTWPPPDPVASVIPVTP